MNVISASSKKYAVISKRLMETGVMPRELANVTLRDIDLDRGHFLSARAQRAHFEKFQVEKRHVSLLKGVSL
jgi:hypothetical protein